MTAAAQLTQIETIQDEVRILHHSQIVPAPWGNVRKTGRDPVKFAEFVADVKVRGIIQAVTVRPHPSQPDMFELLAGYGRHDAAIEADCPVPALIKHVSDAEAAVIGLMENLQREDMNPVDEAEAAKLALTLSHGDYQEAALLLNWKVPQLKQRLHLTRCTESVKAALVERGTDGFRLTLRHADLLAGISQEAQDSLLPEIIKKQMSVETLKELLGKASILLSKARFDIADCVNCPNNTEQQSSLFDEFKSGEGAKCRNLVCFKSKTQAMVDAQRQELTDRYGRIILFSEVNHAALPRVGHEKVGDEQFFSGCLACEHRVALLDDRLDTAGEVQEDRCTKTDCFNDCVRKVQAQAEAAAQAAAQQKRPERSDKPGASSSGTQPKNPASGGSKISATLPSRIVADNNKLLREAVVNAWGSTQASAQLFQAGVILAGLRSLTGKAFSRELPDVLSLSVDELRAAITKEVAFIASDLSNQGGFEMESVMIKTLKMAPDVKTHVVAAWTATPERLSLYTKELLGQILADSGFQAAYEAAHGDDGKKEFNKLMALTRDERIKAIVKFNFDWSHYAPPTYLKNL